MKSLKKSLTVTNNKVEFLKFLKSKFSLYHLSNIFFRDIHYGVMDFLAKKKNEATYTESEKITNEVISYFEIQKIFKRVSARAWVVLYPEFKSKTMIK